MTIRSTIAFISLVLLAILGRVALSSRPVKSVRIHHAFAHLQWAARVRFDWKGKTIVATGDVPDDPTFARVSGVLAQIVGANYVVNETRVASHEQPSLPGQTIGTITIPVNSRYDDSPESLQQISAILRLPQVETVSVTADQTLSNVILGRYRFGPSDLPRSYALLAHRIAELNALRDADLVNPGRLKVPVLPPRALEVAPLAAPPHAGISYYGFSAEGTQGLIVNRSIMEEAVFARGVEPPLSAVSLVSVPVTASDLSSTRSALSNLPSGLSSAKMTITFASWTPAPDASIHKTLSPAEVAVLRATLAKKPSRNATVFILDDGWPDGATYSQSIDELQRLSDIARDHYGFAHVNLKTSGFTPLPSSRPHSSYIRDALKEFTDADTGHIVKIVYVPLSREQNSDPVLRELLLLHFIEEMARVSPSITASDLNAANDYVTKVLTNIQSKYDDQKISTDEAIVEAVWSTADVVAKQSRGKDVFFINESWTVASGSMEDNHPGGSAGIAVVAAGNVPGKIVNSDIEGVDFAKQCASSRSVLAAINVVRGKGIVCNSSIVKSEFIDDTFVASFDGEVFPGANETDCLNGDVDQCACGTSFSAPRISWLLALAEAMRTENAEYATWNVALENKLKRLRANDSVPWIGLYLNPAQLLKP